MDERAIGAQLGCDEGEVRRVIGSVNGKLGADTLEEAVRVAERAAILGPAPDGTPDELPTPIG